MGERGGNRCWEIFRYLFTAASSRELKNIAVVIKKTEPPPPPSSSASSSSSPPRFVDTRGCFAGIAGVGGVDTGYSSRGGGKVSEKRAHDNAALPRPTCPLLPAPQPIFFFSLSLLLRASHLLLFTLSPHLFVAFTLSCRLVGLVSWTN